MKRINLFLTCPKHTKMTDYVIEFKLCGEDDCKLFPRKPRVTLPNDDKLSKEMLGFCPLSALNVHGDTFKPIDEYRRMLDNWVTLKDELKDLERVRADFATNDGHQMKKTDIGKKLTTGINFLKVRHVLRCGDCNAPRCVFSQYTEENKKGPSKTHMQILQDFIEANEYKCGDLVRVYAIGKMTSFESGDDVSDEEDEKEAESPLLFCIESHICQTTVETQYYAPENNQRRGRRVAAKWCVCSHCYTDENLANKDEVK